MTDRKGTKWTNEDDRILLQYYTNGQSYKNISKKLKRTIEAVQARLVKKYLYPKMYEHFYDNNKKLIESNLYKNNFQTILERYAKLHEIDYKNLEKYLKFADKKLKCKQEPQLSDLPDLNEIIDSDSSYDSYEEDLDNSSYDSDDEISETDESSDESDNDNGNDNYKVRYYKYRYLYEKLKQRV